MLRASADSVDRKRFIVSPAENGGSAVGGVRPGEAGRAGDTRERCDNPACSVANELFFSFSFFSNAHLRGPLEAGDMCVCSEMVAVFYLTSNVLLIALLPEFDSAP